MSRPRDITKIAERAKAKDAKLRAARTADSYQNFAAQVGLGTDSLSSGGTYGFNPITRQRTLLEWIHRGSWLGGVAIDLVADDMTKMGVDMVGDIEPEEMEQLERSVNGLGVWNSINDVIKWARLYGGAIGVMLLDGQRLETPLRVESVGKQQFRGVLPLDRWMIEPELNDLVRADEKGVRADEVGLPRFYKVVADAPALPRMKIHYSRCLRLEGIRLPYWQRMMENMWGISVFERLYDRMLAFDSATQGGAQGAFKAFIRTYKIKGLRQLIAAGGEPMAGLVKFVEMMRRFQSSEGITLIDGDDDFTTSSATTAFTGLSELILQFGQQLSGALQIPLVRLFGQSPQGMNATGESDLRTYYDGINQKQVSMLSSATVKIYRMAAASENIKLPEGFGIKFRPLWQLTDAEKITVASALTTAVEGAFTAGIVDRPTALEELRQGSRITGVWTNISDKIIKEAQDEPPPGSLEAMGQQLELQNALAPEPNKTKDQMLGDRQVLGLPCVIEHERGEMRGVNRLPFDYGYIRLTESAERDNQMDICIGPDKDAANVFIVDSYDDMGRFDEHKLMFHYYTCEAALKDFRSYYSTRTPIAATVPRSVLHMWLAGDTDKAIPFTQPTDVRYVSVGRNQKETCSKCKFFNGLNCFNFKVARDPKIPDSGNYKLVSPTGWCEEWEKRVP